MTNSKDGISRKNSEEIKYGNKLDRKQMEGNSYLKDLSTSLYNKNYYIKNINSFALQMIKGVIENKIAGNTDKTWSILFCDIDGLKLVNDTVGHIEADIGIREIASIIKQCVRTNRNPNDSILYSGDAEDEHSKNISIRFGGDEFVVILPNCTKEKAVLIKERISIKINDSRESTKNMTLSIGIVDTTEVKIPTDIDNENDIKKYVNKLISLAEQRMYIDKNRDVKNMSYDEKKQLVLKYLNRLGEQIGFNVDNEDEMDALISILNDIKLEKNNKTK